ncbi:hypothetical protein ACFSM5_17510 [Lacibacterium aquatile]|uniref:Serine kinase n=1 Tax=Lacibacterium aquatile TaxID=1168082 RepID=A0ABW5DXK7_9PROT
MTPRLELCGWQIESSLPLPELFLAKGPLRPKPDFVICLGGIPSTLPDLIYKGTLLQLSRDGSCRLTIPDVATYMIDAQGSQITIASDLPPESPAIRAFLFGTIFALLCQRRQVVPLHAACIRFPRPDGDVAIAITARSGTGKSTLASAFAKRGFQLLADDLTALSHSSDGVWALPTVPRLKLWRDTMDAFKFPPDSFERVRIEMQKYLVPLTESFARSPCRLTAVYHYSRVEDERHAILQPVKGLEAIANFSQSLYQNAILARATQNPSGYLGQVTRMAGAIPSHWKLTHASGLERLDKLIDRIAHQQEKIEA